MGRPWLQVTGYRLQASARQSRPRGVEILRYADWKPVACSLNPAETCVKPSDHPDFFRFPAPEGRSRESTIVLDAEGRFWHEGARVEHPPLASALHRWIARHPDDGRYILTNGYDWTYFTVEDVPFFVQALKAETDRVLLALSDDTEEAWDPQIHAHRGRRRAVREGQGRHARRALRGQVHPARASVARTAPRRNGHADGASRPPLVRPWARPLPETCSLQPAALSPLQGLHKADHVE